MTGFTPIAKGYYLEALLVDGDRIWYTDVTRGGVRCVGCESVLLPERTMIGGLLLNLDGSLLVAGGDGIAWINPETGASGMLVEGLGGVNEMRADGQGGLLFGTIDLASILNGEKPGPSAIWRLSRERTLTQLQDGLTFANGLSFSPDGQWLYFNESFHGVNCWPVGRDGSLGEGAWFIGKYDCDGMALDINGNIWISGFGSDHLLCLTPDGREVTRLPLPGSACTNVRFCGADMQDLVVCIVTPEGAQALADGTPISEQNSTLQKTRAPVAGAVVARTGFSL